MNRNPTITVRLNATANAVEFCVQHPDGSGDAVLLSLPVDVSPPPDAAE